MPSEIRLFALLIGINTYDVSLDASTRLSGFKKLNGAVRDAESFALYLQNRFRVPQDQITLLTNEAATRSQIIDALVKLQNDDRIEKDDAIFLFYAGHGTELPSPKIFKCEEGSKIQAIVPYDCDFVDEKGVVVPPIPDYILGIYLSKIVEKKGNNVTAIFDCCHSASATRGASSGDDSTVSISRSVVLQSSEVYSQQLFQELSELQPVTRGNVFVPKYLNRGLGTHILLAACKATEEAHETNGRGRFSAALLQLLDRVSSGTLQYCDILNQIDKIEGQNPQCEGLNLHRVLFDRKVLPVQRKSFDIVYDGNADGGRGQITVRAGEIHNINLDSEFAVYLKSDISFTNQIGTLLVQELGDFKFTARRPNGAPELNFNQLLVAVQNKIGTEKERIRIYSPPHDGFRKLYEDLVQKQDFTHHPLNNFTLLKSSTSTQRPEVEISLIENKFKFIMSTPPMQEKQPIITHAVDVDNSDLADDELAWIFARMAHFYQELKYKNDFNDDVRKNILRGVDVEFYRLQDDADTDILAPTGSNLCTDGVVNLHLANKADEEEPYGFKITNASSSKLYVNAFLFNTHNLSIGE
ncbi:hypothetical protein BDN70DRAFT_74573 [Pholiota conissans]|uniref:Peptidase C14 caspase domain-containing protein n=1 Tax=Pholiota conissans TaxID=109636 RepID=A0A9P5Z1X3_9AGAR|nr:hypothetical protein BDN70DRAFT_74573 [Pholiota conissans]